MMSPDMKEAWQLLLLERAAQRSAIKVAAEGRAIQLNLDATAAAVEALRKGFHLPPCPPVCKDVE